MNERQMHDQIALKALVDTFSNLADEKRVAEQMDLFTEDAEVTTFIGGKLFADMKGRAAIEQVFSDFLAAFHTVYHLNGQFSVTFTGADAAEAIHYCAVKLQGKQDGQQVLQDHSVRYRDQYVRVAGQWLISKRVANFMISESRVLPSAR